MNNHTPTNDQPEENTWYRSDSDRASLLFTLRETRSPRSGRHLTNDVMVGIERAQHSQDTIRPLTTLIHETLKHSQRQDTAVDVAGWVRKLREQNLAGGDQEALADILTVMQAQITVRDEEISRLAGLDRPHARVETAIIMSDPDFDDEDTSGNGADRLIRSVSDWLPRPRPPRQHPSRSNNKPAPHHASAQERPRPRPVGDLAPQPEAPPPGTITIPPDSAYRETANLRKG